MSCGQKCLSFSMQAKPLPAFAIKPSHKAVFPLSKTDSMKEGFLLTVSSWGCHHRSCQRRPELRGHFLQLVSLTQPAKPPWKKKKEEKRRRKKGDSWGNCRLQGLVEERLQHAKPVPGPHSKPQSHFASPLFQTPALACTASLLRSTWWGYRY